MPALPVDPRSARLRAVSVVGPSLPTLRQARDAERLGAGLAERGLVLVCGGGAGIMEAACRGARSRGGLTVGLLKETAAANANAFVQLALPSGLGDGRNLQVALAGETLIAVGISPGTLSELAFAALHGRPIIAIGAGPPPASISWTAATDASTALAALDRHLDATAP